MGPVFARSVALATEVFLTPTKNIAKCRPRKNPARRTLFRFLGVIFFFCVFMLYAQSIPPADNILQKARVSAGTEETCLIIREVELTENIANTRIK